MPQGIGRPICPRCARPASACLCQWIRPVGSTAHLLILQHPMEVANAKGSARLLHLSVTGSALETGEQFDPDALDGWLHADARRPVLLYPPTPQADALDLAPAAPFDAAWLAAPAQLRLVLLDATWRKSRKMLYLNPALQRLPRMALSAPPPSRYAIRKAHAPDQRSSLEAACQALDQLEGGQGRYGPLLAAFDGFVAAYAARLPVLEARVKQG